MIVFFFTNLRTTHESRKYHGIYIKGQRIRDNGRAGGVVGNKGPMVAVQKSYATGHFIESFAVSFRGVQSWRSFSEN
jgi:hypothetical protein